MSFMRWEPLPADVVTLSQLLSQAGYHTAAAVDTPFYLRGGMNYDRGYQTFFAITAQEGSLTRLDAARGHESRDLRAWWRVEADRNAPRTITTAIHWLERHYKERFFLYVDTWDPHEPWDAPPYYTELYWPGYDGEVIQPVYGHWFDAPGLTEEKVRKARATYMGEITMVDTWIGRLLRTIDNMGLTEKTLIIFTSDHGFYFGEHGGLLREDDLHEGAGRDAPGPSRPAGDVGPFAALRGGGGAAAPDCRAGGDAGRVRRAVVGDRCHAHRARLARGARPALGRGPLAPARAPEPHAPGEGFHGEHAPLRQPGRPGEFRR
jgi:arylsulfatase A-like enzyme